MRRLLMTVQAVFSLLPSGATLAPALPLHALTTPYPETLTLTRPDGSETTTHARFGQTHFNRPYSERTIENTWMLTVWLPDIEKADVPPGSAVWMDLPDEPAGA